MSASGPVNASPEEKKRRPRRRRRKSKKPDRLKPITEAPKLDLTLPSDQDLSSAEQREMEQHLDFIRRFKGTLRLSLNAAEDLLVNRVKPPTDRGQCRHLIAKIDGPAIDRALARDSMVENLSERTKFLAGIVRIKPSLTLLLNYLETLAGLNEQREAAQGFALTINTVDFTTITESQLKRILTNLKTIFSDHDLIQAFFGLMANPSFLEAFQNSSEGMGQDLNQTFGPLVAAYNYLIKGESPQDDENWTEIENGVRQLMASPKSVLGSYPLHARRRLVELASSGNLDQLGVQGSATDKSWMAVTRFLFNSLPKDDPSLDELRKNRFEQILGTEHLDEAARLLKQMQPNKWVQRRSEALKWPRFDRFCVRASQTQNETVLSEALWLDANAFVWLLVAPAEAAGKLSAQARLQAQNYLHSVSPVLHHAMANNGCYFIVFPGGGRPLDQRRPPKDFRDQLRMAWTGVQVLHTLASLSIEIPDINPSRWLLHGKNGTSVTLFDFAGAKSCEPSAASIGHSEAAYQWMQWVFQNKGEVPAHFRKKVLKKVPLPVLVKALLQEKIR